MGEERLDWRDALSDLLSALAGLALEARNVVVEMLEAEREAREARPRR